MGFLWSVYLGKKLPKKLGGWKVPSQVMKMFIAAGSAQVLGYVAIGKSLSLGRHLSTESTDTANCNRPQASAHSSRDLPQGNFQVYGSIRSLCVVSSSQIYSYLRFT